MLSARNRLTASDQFTHVVRRGRRVGGPLLVMHLLDEADAPEPLVGFVVSKAVGNAVTRNLVKRRLRHLMRERIPALPRSARIVVRALPPAADATVSELGGQLDRTLSRLGVEIA